MEVKLMIAIAVAVLLTGCATTQPLPPPEVVKVPVKVGCLGDAPERPVEKFGVGDYPKLPSGQDDHKEAARMALLDSVAWKAYGIAWEVAASGCDKKPADQPAHD